MPKNIIGAGFSDFVAKQIDRRQKKNRIAEKDPDTLFYQNANTAFLRLSSGVNIGETDTSRAKKYQLYNLRFDGEPATGYGLGGNTAYGWESNLGYGFVPPPGLVSADIKSMNRGSLREANINILCHSMDQFNIIEQLYLRLGYSMLLEWGWSWYFTNDGELKKSYHNVATDQYFFNNNSTYISLLNQIQADRQNSNGNYDAMLGRIVNYSWNLERDGSYSITLTMRSVGDVIESLKTNASLNTADPNSLSTTPTGTPLNVNANKSTLNNILYQLSTKVSGYYLPDQVTSTYVGNLVNLKAANTSGDDKKTPKEIVKFDFPNLNPDTSTSQGAYNQFYIKLGKLLDIIQNFLVYYSPKQGNQSIMKFNSSRDENFCFTFPTHGSLDPTICLVPIDEKSTNPVVNTGTVTGAPAPVTYNFIAHQIQYSWYEVSWAPSPGGYESRIWDPNDVNPLFPQQLVDELKRLSPSSVVTKSQEIDNGGVQTKTTNKLSEKALAILQNTSISGEDFKDDYIDEWNYSTFDGDIMVPVEADLGKEYLVANGVLTPGTTGSYSATLVKTATVDLTNVGGDIVDYNIYKHSALTQILYDPSTIVKAATQTSTNPNPSNVLIEDLKDTGFKVDGKYIGSTMDIYVNMDFIARTLDNYIDINTNSISIYDFLSNLMTGIQNALGCVNNFTVTYDEDNNTVRIIDSTFIPNLDKLKSVKQYFEQPPTKFITHTLDTDQGSFVRDATVKTKLSNNFATMVTVGAQANGNVVGENATALSRWNIGLYDRIIKEKLDVTTLNGNAAANAQTTLLNNFTIMQTLYSRINDRGVATKDIESSRNAVTDFFRYYVGKLDIPGIGFLPIDLELTMDGLSGIKIYEAYEADTRLLPKNYQNVIQFITTGISHKIQNNDWTTTLNSISGPKYNGVKIGDPNAVTLDFKPSYNAQDKLNTTVGNLATWGSVANGNGAFNFNNLNSLGGAAFDFNQKRTSSEETKILKDLFNRLNINGQTVFPFNPSKPDDNFLVYDQWIKDFLKTAGLPVNLSNRWFCFVWASQENTAAKYNIFASTKKYNNSTDFNSNSGYPVQNYTSLANGFTANALTIKQKQYYPALYEAMSKGTLNPWAIWEYKI
jgi:hypothetical protein